MPGALKKVARRLGLIYLDMIINHFYKEKKMKKTLFIGLALGLGVFALSLSGGTAMANTTGGEGIVGSSHDLSAPGYGDAQSRICVFCHHPHNAHKTDTNLTYSPLWNHAVTTNAGNFTPYDNGNGPTSGRNALNATMGQPGGVSLLCLSCHDGSVALNAYSNTQGFSTDQQGKADQFINSGTLHPGDNIYTIGKGGDLSNHHPIGFNYYQAMDADMEIANVTKQMTSTTKIKDLLYGGTQFECVSCHDVHNTQNAAGAERFLWKSNDHSNFCLTCHEKGSTHTNPNWSVATATAP